MTVTAEQRRKLAFYLIIGSVLTLFALKEASYLFTG
jgi:hypothetical protein